MPARFRRFLEDDDGAATVDWVVLTAAVVGLGVAAVGKVEEGVVSLGDSIAQALATKTVDNGD